MNWLDVVFGVTVLLLLIRGMFNGFVKEMGHIAGLLLGFVLANRFYTQVALLYGRVIEDGDYAELAAYLSIFLVVMLTISLVVIVVRNILRAAALGGVDRIAGGVLGFVKGFILCVILLIALTAFLSPGSPTLRDSRLAPVVERTTGVLITTLPPSIKRQLDERGAYLQQLWQNDWTGEQREKRQHEHRQRID